MQQLIFTQFYCVIKPRIQYWYKSNVHQLKQMRREVGKKVLSLLQYKIEGRKCLKAERELLLNTYNSEFVLLLCQCHICLKLLFQL